MTNKSGDDFPAAVKRMDAEEKLLKQARIPAQQPRRATNTAGLSKYAAGALSRACDNIESASERNNTANIELFNMGMLVANGLLTPEQIRADIGAACQRAGLGDKEIRLLLRDDESSGLNKGIAAGPRDLSNVNVSEYDDDNVIRLLPPPPPPIELDFYGIEDGFWTARKSLQDIYLAALARMCSPWSVLACCTARALATVRPCITLPPIIGGPGSLNWFGAVTAVSGGGKGAASATAKELVKQYVEQRNTGSGEGIIGAYVRPKDGDVPQGLHESLMFMVDEIDSLTAQTKRSGATTMSVLRSAFSGETLGFSYVNKNTTKLESHTYRMTMVVSVQPARAADLLGDVTGGTPQRFMWFPGIDKRISAEYAGEFIEPLTLPKPGTWQYPTEVKIPLDARELILRERVKAMRGKTDALDGHALFVREKFAFALAVLDGRSYVTQEDWELSAIASRVSDLTRSWVGDTVKEEVVKEATEKGRLQGVSSVAAYEEKNWRDAEKQANMIRLMRKHIKAASQSGLTDREWVNKLNSRDRIWFKPCQTVLVNEGLIHFDADEKRWYTDE